AGLSAISGACCTCEEVSVWAPAVVAVVSFLGSCLRCWCFFWFPQQERKVFSRRRTVLPQCSGDYRAGGSILLHRTLLVYREVPLPALEDQVHFISPKGCSKAYYP